MFGILVYDVTAAISFQLITRRSFTTHTSVTDGTLQTRTYEPRLPQLAIVIGSISFLYGVETETERAGNLAAFLNMHSTPHSRN